MADCVNKLKIPALVQGLDNYTYKYVYPIQFLVTVIGNCLVISVLLSSQIKNRANHLLALLALCDLLVLVCMLPYFFASIDTISENPTFRILYIRSKIVLAALGNWFSAAAIWFVLAVSIERLLIIKFPFRSLNNYNKRNIILLGIFILAATFLLTSYHYHSYTCMHRMRCNNTVVLVFCIPNTQEGDIWNRLNITNTYTDMAKSYIKISTLFNAIFAVIGPIFAVTILNISLIRLLKKRNTQELIANSVNANPSHAMEQERKMTTTVVAIVTCFSLTQGPSAALFLYDMFTTHARGDVFTQLSAITNSLVLTGKMLNVVLFCLTSSTFRRRMLLSVRMWCGTIYYCNKKQAMLSTRSLSRSLLTQKTSIAHSPSIKILPRRLSQIGRMESFNMRIIKKSDTKQSLLNNTISKEST